MKKIYVLIEEDPTVDECCAQVVGAFTSKRKCYEFSKSLGHSCNWYKIREFDSKTGKLIQQYEPYDGNPIVGSCI